MMNVFGHLLKKDRGESMKSKENSKIFHDKNSSIDSIRSKNFKFHKINETSR